MKIFNLINFLLLFTFYSHAQHVSVDTTILSGNDLGIYEQKNLQINSKNEKFLISTFKNSYTSNNVVLTSNLVPSIFPQSRSLFIEKYDSNNHFVWAKKIAESDTLIFFKACIDANDNIWLSIMFRDFIKMDSIQIQSAGMNDNILIKINENGNIKKNKTIASIYADEVSSIAADKYGNLYLAGIAGVNGTLSCPIYFDSIQAITMPSFIAKLDSNGNYKWVKNAQVFGLYNLVCNGNSIYCSGETNIIDTFLGVPIQVPLSNYTYTFFVGKFDSSGQGIWTRYFGNTAINGGAFNEIFIASRNNRVSVTSNAYAQLLDGNVFKFQNGPTLTGYGAGIDCMIYTLDTSGNFIWNNVSKSDGDEYYASIAIDSFSSIKVTGSYNYNAIIGNDSLYNLGSDDFVTVSYDSMGLYQWFDINGGYNADIVMDMKLDSYQRPFILGSTTSPWIQMGNDSITITNTNSQLLFARLDTIQAPSAVQDVEFNGLKIYPNPASSVLYITSENWNLNTDQISLESSLGQPIFIMKPSLNANPISINLQDLKPGLYFLSCSKNNKTKIFKIIVTGIN